MRDFANFDDDFKRKSEEFDKRKDTMLKIVGETHKNMFRKSWRLNRFNDYGSQPWKKPNRRDNNTAFPPPEESVLDNATLVGKAGGGGSGLQDSFEVDVRIDEVAIINTKPYAEIHNEGGTIQIPVTKDLRKQAWMNYYITKRRGAKNYESWKHLALTKKNKITVKIPQRKFMGHSLKIDEEAEKEINQELNDIL